jgi:acyl dehydratase
MSLGRYFEEFEVGQIFKHWPGRTITEFDNTWFTLMTMSQHPLHIDAHYARSTQHGKCLVNGTLVFSLVAGMSVADISGKAIANLEYEAVQHTAPVFHGDSIYAESRILEKRESGRSCAYAETQGPDSKDATRPESHRRIRKRSEQGCRLTLL